MLLSIAIVTAVLGAVLLGAGARGRRVHDHPLCKACGYDLSGQDEETGNCPECGRRLARRGAVRIGLRRRNSAIVVIGAVLLLLGGGLGGSVLWGQSRSNTVKAVWLLAWEMNHGIPAVRQGAFDELEDRLKSRALSPRQHRRFAAACLSAIHDLDRPWNPAWSDVIAGSNLVLEGDSRTTALIETILRRQADREVAWITGLGSRMEWLYRNDLVFDEEWASYLRQAVEPFYEIDAPGRIRPDQLIHVSYRRTQTRLGSMFTSLYAFHPRGPEWRIDLQFDALLHEGAPIGPAHAGAVHPASMHDGTHAGSDGMDHTLAPGTYQLELPVRFVINGRTRRLEESDGKRRWVLDTDTEITSWQRTYRVPIEIVPESTVLVEAVDEPGQAGVIAPALSVRVRRSDERASREPDGSIRRSILVAIDERPVNVAFEVFLRGADREVRIGSLAAARCTDCSSRAMMGWPDVAWLQGIDRAEAVFRTDIGGAEERGMKSVWSGEIVLPNVCLKRLPFRDAPPEEQRDRLREDLEVSVSYLDGARGGRHRYLVMMTLRDVPVALHHRVGFRAGDQTCPLDSVSGEVESWLSASGTVELDATIDPGDVVEFIFTPIETPRADAPDDVWAEPFTISSDPLPALR